MHIRGKMFSNDLMYELLEIARRENPAEELINFIAGSYRDADEELEVKLEDAKEELEQLRKLPAEIAKLNKTIEGYESSGPIIAANFKSFVGKFRDAMGRHPSIDETWEAAWRSYMKQKKCEGND